MPRQAPTRQGRPLSRTAPTVALQVRVRPYPPPKHDAPLTGAQALPASKLLPAPGAAPSEWAAAIERQRAARNSIALHALIEAVPASLGSAHRARLLALGASALAATGLDPRTDPAMRANARRAFDDLLAASERAVRLAAINAFALAYPDERDPLLRSLLQDPDPVIRAKAEALLAALD